MQLAIWNLVYDSDFSIGSGTLTDQRAYAPCTHAQLSGASNTATSLYTVSALQRAGTQDFLLAAKAPPPTPGIGVPEPGSLALRTLALLGAAAGPLRRRFSAKRR